MFTIGISGRAGVGKDTVATRLCELLRKENIDVKPYSLASPMNDICNAVFEGIDWEDRKNKEKEFLLDVDNLKNVLYTYTELLVPQELWESSKIKIDETFTKCYYSPRQIKQLFGTEVIRAVYPDAWVEMASEEDCFIKVIPDVRFSNELDYVNVLIHVVRDVVVDVSHHPSEELAKVLDEEYATSPTNKVIGDFAIIFFDNNRDITWLNEQIDEVADGLIQGWKELKD